MVDRRACVRAASVIGRRTFFACIAWSALAAPGSAGAQADRKVARIGLISNASGSLPDSWWEAFAAGLREQGWTEHQNLVIERRYAELRKDASVAVAEELVRLKVDVIVVSRRRWG